MSRHRSSKGPRESTRAVRALGTPSTHTPKRASLSPSPMLHHTAIFLILMLVILQTPISANPFASGEITINPDNPTGSWQSPRALYPGESVRITINVDSSGNNYELEGSPSLSTLGPGSLWSPTSNNSPSEYTYVYEAVNAGTAPTSDAIQVDATWTEQLDPPSGGGGGTPPEPDSIDGYAVGVAYTNKPVFSWNSNPKLQFADGQTIIDFSVTASANGAAIDLADYTVKGENSWTVDSNPNGNNIAGTVKSGNPSEGELKITFDGKFQDTSPDKIGFAELDLAIAKFGSGDDLKEDRQPGGGTASPPHEMDPGGLVIASFEGSESTPIRTKLTLTGSSQNPGSNGKYFLSQQSLTKAKIYDAPVDGQEITLPKEWSSSAFGNGQTLYIESEEFAATDDPEEGTLKLKYQCELNGNTESLEDEVKLNLLPVDLRVRKQGTAEAPATGLLVTKGDVLELAIGKDYFNQDKQFEELITWEFRRLKGDGSYTTWAPFGAHGKGTKFEHTTSEGGIYQLRIEADGSHVEFLRDKDAPNIAGSNGIENPKLKAGEPDFVGVVSKGSQISVRDFALAHLGSTAWAKSAPITVGSGVDPALRFAGSWKCNLFVFMVSNASGIAVPTKIWQDKVFGIPPIVNRPVPPGANDWYNPGFAIPNWTWQAASTSPEPGWVAIHQHTSDAVSGGAHLGFLDYDGTWINAGLNNVNKSIHVSDASYQPTNYRKPK